VTAGVVTAAVSVDFGAQNQQQLAAHAEQLFGVNNPLEASSTVDLNQAQALATSRAGSNDSNARGSDGACARRPFRGGSL
jgi:hypothetical protein